MKTTLFISDLHLDARRPAITDLFLAFLAGLDAAACAGVYILGDLFEAWIGDDNDDAHDQRILAALRVTTERGIPIWVIHGNRDFLLGKGFAHATGCTLLADPTLIELNGEPTLLMHGDTLCTDDLAYQALRRRVRRPLMLSLLRQLPFAWRRRLARQARAGSEAAKAGKAADIMDVNADAVVSVLRGQQVRRLIHGHTHRPAQHVHTVDGRDCERWVLPDWYARWGYVVCDAAGCALRVEDL